MPIDHCDRALKFNRGDFRQNPIEQCKHFAVRIGTAAKQDHSGAVRTLDGKQPWIVEIGGDDNAGFTASDGEDFIVRHGREPDGGRVRRLMPKTPEMLHRVRRHRHIDQKPHLNSITSSSARLAA